jgi:hypothetical protein
MRKPHSTLDVTAEAIEYGIAGTILRELETRRHPRDPEIPPVDQCHYHIGRSRSGMYYLLIQASALCEREIQPPETEEIPSGAEFSRLFVFNKQAETIGDIRVQTFQLLGLLRMIALHKRNGGTWGGNMIRKWQEWGMPKELGNFEVVDLIEQEFLNSLKEIDRAFLADSWAMHTLFLKFLFEKYPHFAKNQITRRYLSNKISPVPFTGK